MSGDEPRLVCGCPQCEAYREAYHATLDLLHQASQQIYDDHRTIIQLRNIIKQSRRILKTNQGLWVFFSQEDDSAWRASQELTDSSESITLGNAQQPQTNQSQSRQQDGTDGAEGHLPNSTPPNFRNRDE